MGRPTPLAKHFEKSYPGPRKFGKTAAGMKVLPGTFSFTMKLTNFPMYQNSELLAQDTCWRMQTRNEINNKESDGNYLFDVTGTS